MVHEITTNKTKELEGRKKEKKFRNECSCTGMARSGTGLKKFTLRDAEKYLSDMNATVRGLAVDK